MLHWTQNKTSFYLEVISFSFIFPRLKTHSQREDINLSESERRKRWLVSHEDKVIFQCMEPIFTIYVPNIKTFFICMHETMKWPHMHFFMKTHLWLYEQQNNIWRRIHAYSLILSKINMRFNSGLYSVALAFIQCQIFDSLRIAT